MFCRDLQLNCWFMGMLLQFAGGFYTPIATAVDGAAFVQLTAGDTHHCALST